MFLLGCPEDAWSAEKTSLRRRSASSWKKRGLKATTGSSGLRARDFGMSIFVELPTSPATVTLDELITLGRDPNFYEDTLRIKLLEAYYDETTREQLRDKLSLNE